MKQKMCRICKLNLIDGDMVVEVVAESGKAKPLAHQYCFDSMDLRVVLRRKSTRVFRYTDRNQLEKIAEVLHAS